MTGDTAEAGFLMMSIMSAVMPIIGLKKSDLPEILIHDFRLSGVSYGRCDLTSPWGIAFAAQPLLRFHF